MKAEIKTEPVFLTDKNHAASALLDVHELF